MSPTIEDGLSGIKDTNMGDTCLKDILRKMRHGNISPTNSQEIQAQDGSVITRVDSEA